MAHVQSNSTGGDTADPQTLAFGSNVKAGNCIVVYFRQDNTNTVTASDNLGNTYTQVNTVTHGAPGSRATTFIAKNIVGGACTVSITGHGAGAADLMMIGEYSGRDKAGPVDGSNAQGQDAPGTGADGVSSGNFTPANNDCDIVGFTSHFVPPDGIAVGTGFTSRQSAGDGTYQWRSEDKVLASAALTAATFTLSVDHPTITAGLALKPRIPGVDAGYSAFPKPKIREAVLRGEM